MNNLSKETIQTFFTEAQQRWSVLKTNKVIFWSTIITLLLIVLSMSILILSFRYLPPQIPLWFSRPWSTDRLASPWWLWILPGSSLFIVTINTFLSITLTRDHLVFSQILLLSCLTVSFLSLWTLSTIVWMIL